MKKTEQGQVWVMHADVLPEQSAPGLTRRVLAFDKPLMCVENTFEKDAVVVPHSHPHEQITYIQQGEFLATVGDEQRKMVVGDTIYVAGNVSHALTCISDGGIAIDMFNPMREDFIG